MAYQPHIRDFMTARVHMIGIGGSSMSGLAELLLKRGCAVSGSDRDEGYMIELLRKQGATVYIGHAAENAAGANLVVYSAAISNDNPELQYAFHNNIPTLTRAKFLGQLMEGFENAVAVAGTHGKTTTSAMLAQALIGSGLDPTVHLGGRFDAIGGSTRIGGDKIFVAEACEFNASFLEMSPTVAVILNIDADHLDFYRDIDHIQATFEQFAARLPNDGTVIGNGDDPRVRELLSRAKCNTASFGLDPANDWHPEDLVMDERGRPRFKVIRDGEHIADLALQVYGKFNVYNALGAFQPVHRRFEITGTVDGVTLVHDYGHNPVEMAGAVSVAAVQPHKTLWAVIQPHTYSRVKKLFKDYIHCCDEADKVLVTDIYAAREIDPGDISAAMLVDEMRKDGIDAYHTPTFDDTEKFLRENWKSGDMVLTMGCGNINLLNSQIQAHGDTQS